MLVLRQEEEEEVKPLYLQLFSQSEDISRLQLQLLHPCQVPKCRSARRLLCREIIDALIYLYNSERTSERIERVKEALLLYLSGFQQQESHNYVHLFQNIHQFFPESPQSDDLVTKLPFLSSDPLVKALGTDTVLGPFSK
jgi:hypothetical protein